MVPKPVVSVIIPAYNPGGLLREALASVVAQDFKDWECVVVDDGSDEDLSWASGLDVRIRVVRQGNHGVSAARNAGARVTTGDYLAFLDADDLWLPGKLTAQVGSMSVGAPFSATGFFRFTSTSKLPGWRGDTSFSQLLRGNSLCASSVMVSRVRFEQVGGYDERLRIAEDWDLWMRLARLGDGRFIPEVLTGYRVHEMQTSGKPVGMWLWSLVAIVKQRGPLGASIAGARRVSEIYGAQIFDKFRETRDPRYLAIATIARPRYIAGEVRRQIALKLFR